MKAILIVFFHLLLMSVKLKEYKLLVLQKPPHFSSKLKFYTFKRAIAVIMIIQLSKKKESTRTICAQTAPVGWPIPQSPNFDIVRFKTLQMRRSDLK